MIGVETLVSVKVALMMQGVTNVCFTKVSQWVLLYFLKEVKMCGTPVFVDLTKSFNFFFGVRASSHG